MGIGKEVENLSSDAQEYVKRSIDGIKLHLVEKLSLLLGDLLCGFVVFMLLFMAFLLLLGALVVVALPYVGFWPAMSVAAFLLLVTAVVVYRWRVRLFVDKAVARLAGLFFREEASDE